MEPHSTARDWQARIRLWAALVICFFELLSILVYAAGWISGEAMQQVLAWEEPLLLLFPLFSVALYTHMGLALWKFFQRNTLKMAVWEAFQLGLGLLIPLLMVTPSLALTLMDLKYGTGGMTTEALLVGYPEIAWRTAAMTLIVVIHAQIGVHTILRMRRWYPQVRWFLFTVLVALPLAAVSATFLTQSLGAFAPQKQLTAEQLDFLRLVDLEASVVVIALYALLFLARELRLKRRESFNTIEVLYAGGRVVRVAPGTTVLEASRIHGIPHASICGGRGRCTTCRIKVNAGQGGLSPVGEREHKALTRIGAAEGIRLACQAQCQEGPLEIAILLPQSVHPRTARRETPNTLGRDVELAVMFVDLRGFTSLSEQKFPYDVVFILNNYFQTMGNAIQAAGGVVDKFLGDGILAYFGLDTDPREGCRNALLASREMARSLHDLNLRLSHVLTSDLQIGISIHFGDLILGEIGFDERRQLTIIGDTVNTASRLESLNKKMGSQLILSSRVAALAGADLAHLPMASVTPRGKEEPLRVYVVKSILEGLADLG
ncbi:MAG: adenylate/guanylate cyclase domain-containing protein [Spirochaetales bacterium]